MSQFDFKPGKRYRVVRKDGLGFEGHFDSQDSATGTFVLNKVRSFNAEGKDISFFPTRRMELELKQIKQVSEVAGR